MAFTTNHFATLTDLLAGLAAEPRTALQRKARRFASLISFTGAAEIEGAAGIEAEVASQARAVLRITSGLHRGATLELNAREYLIGSDDDCDIVLRDEYVATQHCRIARKWSGFEVRDLHAGGSQAVAPKAVVYEAGGIEAQYDVGGVVFALHQAPVARAGSQHDRAHASFARGAALAALVIGIPMAIWTFGADRQASWRTTHPLNEPIVTGHSKQLMSGLLEQARHALADDRLQVEARNGRLSIEGITTDAAVKTRIRALSDDLRGTIAVEDHVEYVESRGAPGPFPLRLRGVMIGQPSYFLTDTGARYFVGGVLPDGAEVLAIEASQIRFRMQGRIITYRLQ